MFDTDSPRLAGSLPPPPVDLREAFAASIEDLMARAHPEPPPLAVAWSGGPDSTALLHLALDLASRDARIPRPLAFHVLHEGFRSAKELQRDRLHVEREARGLGVSLETRTVFLRGTPAAPRARSEATARQARYGALAAMARARGIAIVLLGHTEDDQRETLLFRLHRGTGLRGLAGIPAMRPLAGAPPVFVARPLLGVARRDLLSWLVEAGIPFLDDPTNRDVSLARNRIRHQWLPALRLLGGQAFVAALEAAATSAGRLREEIDAELKPLLPPSPPRDRAEASLAAIPLDRKRLRDLRPRLIRAAIYEAACRLDAAGKIHRRHLEPLVRRIRASESGKAFDLPGHLRVRVDRREVVVERTGTASRIRHASPAP